MCLCAEICIKMNGDNGNSAIAVFLLFYNKLFICSSVYVNMNYTLLFRRTAK